VLMQLNKILFGVIVFILVPYSGHAYFVDVTELAGVRKRQMSQTYDVLGSTLLERMMYSMTGGVSVGDYNNDGYQDLFYTRFDEPPILYKNNTNGTFSDVSHQSGIAVMPPEGANGSVMADIDNDGDQDIYVTSINNFRYHLYINNGDGTFYEDAENRGVAMSSDQLHGGQGIAVGDIDNDGFLDMFVGEWKTGRSKPSYVALFRNRGMDAPGYFYDVTLESGIDLNDVVRRAEPIVTSTVFSPNIIDLDMDGWADIVMAADYETSRLYWNNGDGTFTDGTIKASVGTDRNGMGSTFGDFNNDGLLDWFITAIENRDGNRLYLNQGGRFFRDFTDESGLRQGGWGWGASGFDYDNDGDLDIVHTNGMSSENLLWSNDPTYLYENIGGGVFKDVAKRTGISHTADGRGLATLDYDNDGDMDLIIINNSDYPSLFRNDVGNNNSWLILKLVGRVSNRDAIGAHVTVILNQEIFKEQQIRFVDGGSNFLGHDDLRLHFGLGAHKKAIALIEIKWPSGITQRLYNTKVNSFITVVEPTESLDKSYLLEGQMELLAHSYENIGLNIFCANILNTLDPSEYLSFRLNKFAQSFLVKF
jgi:enediyne biosynthesis protein E4